jgi:NADH-quinone oxidoreductase subunit G
VGALLDKDFLFKQRVWLLKETPSISPADAGGENIWLHHNEGIVYRVKPRYNAEVNQWWISDDTRYSFKPIHDTKRLKQSMRMQYGTQIPTLFNHAIDEAALGLKNVVKENGAGSLYAMFSPMMACEEAYLLGKYIRLIDPQAPLVLGPVPTSGANESFKNSVNGKTTFTIQAEKVPNAAGIRRVIKQLGGPTATMEELAKSTKLKGGWIVGGYLSAWTSGITFPRGFKVVQDILPSALADGADILLPAASWAEKDGSWENFAGKVQTFAAAIPPADGARREGDIYYRLLSRTGFYNAAAVRREMGEPFDTVAPPSETRDEPAFEFAEL